jgi:DNA-binding MarR family transcriptional regulator
MMMPTDETLDSPAPVQDDEAEALLAACRVLVAVSARSIAAVDSVVDITEFRVLVVVAGEGSVSIQQVADHIQVHPATARRICDRLTLMNLLQPQQARSAHREEHLRPVSQRFTLTAQGQGVVHMVMSRRRAAIEPALGRLSPADRGAIVAALRTFTQAAGEPERHELWAMGWTH